ncbi:MAG: tetratricopeptide repeat protein [Planctomycetes bacterium]|nr:tetratricopeptide repeat protein [Planctomycetota bacterium]
MASSAETTFRATRQWLVVAFAAFALLAPGCKAWSSFKERSKTISTTFFETGYEDPKVPEKMTEAQALYAEGKYEKALKAFREVADNTQNPAGTAETARFMMAECRYARGQYPEAVDTYHKLLNDFPTGAHRRESCARMFEICDYWLDDFRAELTRRSGEEGVLRWHPEWKNPLDKTRPLVGQEGRTLEALDHIWTHDMTGPTADKALFWCGYVNYVRGNFQEADHFFSTLVEMHKESPLRPQAMSYAIQAKNNATGGAEYDGRKCAEALQLVYVAEATLPELTQVPEMADKLTRAKFAIRYQQAEKDFRMAEYYERTGHPGSAVFYYELVRRRYAATRYAELATDRKEHLVALMKEGKPAPGRDPFAIVQAKWKEVFGKPSTLPATADEAEKKEPVLPAAGTMPVQLPAGAVQTGP